MMCKRKNLNLIILICLYLQIDNSMAKDNEFFLYKKTYTQPNICKKQNSNYITSLNINFTDKVLNGVYYGIVKNEKKSYTIEISFKNNLFDSLVIYNNNKKPNIGILGYEDTLTLLRVKCPELYVNTLMCHKDKIFKNNKIKINSLENLCNKNNLLQKNLEKSRYLDNIFSDYMYLNGFKVNFINDIIRYKERISNGILNCYTGGDDCDD